MAQQQHIGKVIIAGAGPGDPELITVKATRALAIADVVLTDRLVSNAIIDSYVGPNASVIYVGKQCRRGNSTPQETINSLLVEHASQGKLVVRLKGGDISVFSNILDELQTLREHAIPYELIPGITAATGAAAYAGIPLTARGLSTAVRLLTYYKQEVVSDEYWKDLAHTSDTLVFYMSAETLDGVVTQLIRYGIGADKHLAVVEQGTTPMQQVVSVRVNDYFSQWAGRSFVSPSLVIIGRVAALHQDFGWIENAANRDLYFKPVSPIHQPQNQSRHVARA